MEAAEHDETEKKGGFIIGFSETKRGVSRGVRGLDLNISQTERFCFECAIINVIYDLKSI